MDDLTTYDPFEFASPDYAAEFHPCFDAYIELRVQGIPRDMAVIDAFELIRLRVDVRNADALGMAADANPYVKARFAKVLAAKTTEELWDGKKAVLKLLTLIEDPRVRDTTRLNAVHALNALTGLITLDDGTKRKIGHTLQDFWKMGGTPAPVTTH
ncbi:hypothetical protein [Paraburkholderia graminis]|uniref:hypothetical protein n=1 Tax=Paraburkholderia graminis TaxID=60548 RepID=UPI0038BB33E4